MTQLALNLMGFAQGNAQMTAEVWDPATNLRIANAPVMADGSVRMANIPTGAYQIKIKHPNLFAEVATQIIYVTPTGETTVSMLIDPTKFKNSAIVDLPEANLAPIATMMEAIELAAKGLTNKMPGEILTAAWANGVAFAIRDLAHAVTLLARSVTPVGHNHVEYENKINEISTNFQGLVQTLAESTVQMQRKFDIQKLRESVEDIFAIALTLDKDKRNEALVVLTELEKKISQSPQLYSQSMRESADKIRAALAETILNRMPKTGTNLTDAAKKIVENYEAVIAQWASRVVRDVFTEINQGTIDIGGPRKFTLGTVGRFDTAFAIPTDGIVSQS
jgi:hypothetical protein